MFCQNCGKKLEDGASFCTQCGSAIGQPMSMGSQPNIGMKKPLGKKPVIIGICAAAVIIMVVVLAGKMGFGGKASAPEGAIDNWDYTLDDDYVTLNYYKGNEADVIVYASYPIDGKVYKTRIASNPSDSSASNISFVAYMFNAYAVKQCEYIVSIVFEDGIDMSNVTSMFDMFSGCKSLTSLDLSSFDTSKVTSMVGMFSDCASLTSLDLSSFDTSSVTNMWAMFQGCSSLTSLDLSSFNTSNVTSMFGMFFECSSLTSLDLSSFNTSKVTSMVGMFSGCSSLTSLDLSSFDISNVIDKNMYGMLSRCSSNLTVTATQATMDKCNQMNAGPVTWNIIN